MSPTPLLAALLFLAPLAAATPEAPPPRETVALVGFDLLPMSAPEDPAEEVLHDHTLLVVDGRIAAVGPRAELEVPEGARVVRGEGGWLLPGLVEMHGHLPSANAPAGFTDDVLLLYLANGVTTVRGMLGEPSQLALRDAIAAGERAGPRLFVGSPPLHGGLGLDPDGARARVAAFADAGYDHLKVHEGLTPEVFAVIAAAAGERGLRFGGHVADAVGLWGAVEAGQSTVDHMDNVLEALLPATYAAGPFSPTLVTTHAERERLPDVARRLAASGAAVVPTQALWAVLFGGVPGGELRAARQAELRYMPRVMVDGWEAQVDAQAATVGAETGAAYSALRDAALAALAEAGAPILLGTDSPQLFSVPGFSLHREIRAMAAAGLDAAAILDAGTAAPARFHGPRWDAGTLQPGRRADLVVLSGDPRADLSLLERPRGVLADGRWWSREVLDARLAAVAEKHAD